MTEFFLNFLKKAKYHVMLGGKPSKRCFSYSEKII